MQSKARGKESLDEKRKQITAHKLLWEFINLEDGNPRESGLINSLEPFQRYFCSGSFSRYFPKTIKGLISISFQRCSQTACSYATLTKFTVTG